MISTSDRGSNGIAEADEEEEEDEEEGIANV